MMDISVDDKCVELAEHFLQDVNGATPSDYQELAEQIQKLCEEFCADIEGHEPGNL